MPFLFRACLWCIYRLFQAWPRRGSPTSLNAALGCWIIRLIEVFHEEYRARLTSASNGIVSISSLSPLIESAAFRKALNGVATVRMAVNAYMAVAEMPY